MSADTRKARSDSKLKTLPEERQHSIAEFARAHSLDDTVAWLKEDGLTSSAAALSEFLSWYALRAQLARNQSTVESVLEELKQSRPELTESQLFAAGQSFFGALAIEKQDAEAWSYVQGLKIKSETLKLQEKKFQVATCKLFLKWSEDRRASEIVESKAGNSEKIEQLRQLMFGDLAEEPKA